jgi:hypothetical protein
VTAFTDLGLGRGTVSTSHNKGEPYYEGCGVYTAGFGRRDQVTFFLRQRRGDEARLFFPCPLKALGDETRFLFSCVDERRGYETRFLFSCVIDGLGYETRFLFSCVDEGLGYETRFLLFCVDEG